MAAVTLRSAVRWYVNGLRSGGTIWSPRRRVGAVCCVGLLASPLLALVSVVVLAMERYLLAALFSALAGLALGPAVAMSLRQRARRRRKAAARPPSVGGRGSTPEQKLASAVGAPFAQVKPLPREASASPRVTVVVACFNDAHLLGSALHSVARQSVTDLQCVVVDDASTDESMDVAMLFAQVDRRFHVVRHATNLGLSAARNTGLAHATGTYVTFLDSDDFLYRESLEQRLTAVIEEPACVGAYCAWRSVPETTGYHPVSTGAAPPKRNSVHLLTTGYEVPFIASAPIVRTDVMRATGGFDETLRTAEDADMWSRLLRGGVWLAYARYWGVAYRQREGSMIRRDPLHHFEVVARVADTLDAPWDAVWDGAPSPVIEPLGAALRRFALLARQLNFLALHLALHGTEGVDARHVPHEELRTLPDYGQRVRTQCTKALRRLGRYSDQAVDDLVAHVLSVAPPPDRQLSLSSPAPAGLADSARTRSLRHPLEVLDVSALRDEPPAFLLAPQSRYHVAEVGPLLESLRARGIRAEVYLPPEANQGVSRELSAYAGTVYVGDPSGLKGLPVLGCFMLNDWAPSTQALIAAAREAGGVSFAKVEGVQDFTDVDTGRVRRPYQHADVVLGQGPNDVAALPSQDVRVVGSTRLERIWAAEPVCSDMERVLINFNFTYGVLTDKQDEWLWAAVDGARSVGVDYEISLHPAQKNVPKDPAVQDHISTDPFSHALRRSGVLISRFSTVLYEAMALGVPALYLNCHGEQVPTFQAPSGAFVKVTGTELGEGIAEALSWRGTYRARAEQFFRRQVDIDPTRSSEERTADVIVALLKG